MDELKNFNKENDIFSFSFVRHPFDRLASVYTNMIAPVYGKEKSRGVPMRFFNPKRNGWKITFPKFVRIVLRNPCPMKFNHWGCYKANEHWRPLMTG